MISYVKLCVKQLYVKRVYMLLEEEEEAIQSMASFHEET